jgi:hypothetical protein
MTRKWNLLELHAGFAGHKQPFLGIDCIQSGGDDGLGEETIIGEKRRSRSIDLENG